MLTQSALFYIIKWKSNVGNCLYMPLKISPNHYKLICSKKRNPLSINVMKYTVSEYQYHTPSREERRLLYFNHLSKEFLEQMISHLKALI